MTRRLAVCAALVLLGAVSACGGSSPATSAFGTRVEAGAAVPAWVPTAATDLKVQSDDGSGAFWLRFRLPEADRRVVEAELLRIPDGQVATLTFSTLRSSRGRRRSSRRPPRTFVAFDRASDAVYAWSPGPDPEPARRVAEDHPPAAIPPAARRS